MGRIILLLTGIIVAIFAIPMYMLLSLWIAIFEEYERRRDAKRKEKENEQRRAKRRYEGRKPYDPKDGGQG